MMIKERRQHTRLDNNVPVKISCDDFDLVTETRNISCAGAYCRVNRYIEPMTRLKVILLLPLKRKNKGASKKISCQGVVVRVESDPCEDYYRIAVFFSDIQPKERKIIAQFVDSSLQKNSPNKL